MTGRQRLPTDNNDDDVDATTTSKRDYNDEDGDCDSDGGYEGDGYAIVRHPETAVVEEALKRIVSRVRVELG